MVNRQEKVTESRFGSLLSLSLLIATALCSAVIPAHGQAGKATISGAVTDPSGAVIAGAEVTVTNTLTGLTTRVTSADNGTYVVPLLPVGTYTLTFSHPGFRTVTRTDIV